MFALFVNIKEVFILQLWAVIIQDVIGLTASVDDLKNGVSIYLVKINQNGYSLTTAKIQNRIRYRMTSKRVLQFRQLPQNGFLFQLRLSNHEPGYHVKSRSIYLKTQWHHCRIHNKKITGINEYILQVTKTINDRKLSQMTKFQKERF